MIVFRIPIFIRGFQPQSLPAASSWNSSVLCLKNFAISIIWLTWKSLLLERTLQEMMELSENIEKWDITCKANLNNLSKSWKSVVYVHVCTAKRLRQKNRRIVAFEENNRKSNDQIHALHLIVTRLPMNELWTHACWFSFVLFQSFTVVNKIMLTRPALRFNSTSYAVHIFDNLPLTSN